MQAFSGKPPREKPQNAAADLRPEKFPPKEFLSVVVVYVFFRARQKGDSKREKPDPERTFSQIFADFR